MRRAEAKGLVGVVSTWLLDTSSGSSVGVGALVDGGLHLLEELINVHQVGFGSKVGHGRESVLLLRKPMTSMAIHSNHGWASWHVVGDGATVKRNTLEGNQSLANLSIGSWVDLTALSISKEVVQGVIAPSSIKKSRVVLAGDITTVGGIVDWASIRRSLLVVTGVVSWVRMSIWCGSGTWVHGSSVLIIVARLRSCLSVSQRSHRHMLCFRSEGRKEGYEPFPPGACL